MKCIFFFKKVQQCFFTDVISNSLFCHSRCVTSYHSYKLNCSKTNKHKNCLIMFCIVGFFYSEKKKKILPQRGLNIPEELISFYLIWPRVEPTGTSDSSVLHMFKGWMNQRRLLSVLCTKMIGFGAQISQIRENWEIRRNDRLEIDVVPKVSKSHLEISGGKIFFSTSCHSCL